MQKPIKSILSFYRYSIFGLLTILVFMQPAYAQENRSFGIGTDIIKLNYENLANETFGRIWDDTVEQRIKIPLIDSGIDVDFSFGGSIVSFEEMLQIPELKALYDQGKFPSGKFYIKHQCQLTIKGSVDFRSFSRVGLELPYKVSYIECIDEAKGKEPKLIKKKAIQFLVNYVKMIHNRFDKSVGAFEDALLHGDILLDVGERISVERFFLFRFGVSKPGLKFALDNPILTIKGQAEFTLFELSRTLGHAMYTVQNFGDPHQYRVTVTKKKVVSLEFLSVEFGFEFKTVKRLLELGKLSIDINLIRYRPTMEKYFFRHYQYYADFSQKKMFRHFKRITFLGLNNFFNHKREDVHFYRSFQIRGCDFYNNINLLNLYKNNRLEKIENTIIDLDLNRRENLGYGQFKRYKKVFANSMKMNCEIIRDYTHLKGVDNTDRSHSGVEIQVDSDDQYGLTDLKRTYLMVSVYLLKQLSNEPIDELEHLISTIKKEPFASRLKIEVGSECLERMRGDKLACHSLVQSVYDDLMLKLPITSDFQRRLLLHLKAMLLRVVNRLYKMNALLDYNFETSKQRFFSVKKVSSPKQLPLRDVYYLILAFAFKDDVRIVYEARKMDKKTSASQPQRVKSTVKFEYVGKNFTPRTSELKFHY